MYCAVAVRFFVDGVVAGLGRVVGHSHDPIVNVHRSNGSVREYSDSDSVSD